MNVQEFCEKWGVKRPELSLLLGVPLGTMAHWFAAGAHERSTPVSIQKTLTQLDFLFTVLLSLKEQLPEARSVFDVVCERKKGTVFQSQKKRPE